MDKEENIQENSARNLIHLRKWDFCLELEGADPALQEAMDEGLEKQQGQNQECLLYSFLYSCFKGSFLPFERLWWKGKQWNPFPPLGTPR